MSLVAKVYDRLERIEKILGGRMFKTVFIAISSMFLFFGAMNVFAQTDTTTVDASEVNLSPAYTGIEATQNLANGTSKDEKNISTQSGVSVANAIFTGITWIAPAITKGGSEITNDPDVPVDMKEGLLGTADSAMTYAFTGYPSTNVASHLAEEWVPGYESSTSSLYAADSTSKNGYETLMATGIAPLWNKIRDFAYLFFVVIMIIVGFMIMFRSKIGGQTLVTLGNFLPGVISSLVLITFSFAIAGLVIDIGGLLTSVIAGFYDGNVIPVSGFWNLMKTAFTGYQTWTVTGINAGIGGILTGVGISGVQAAIAATGAASIGTVATAGAGIILLLLILVILGVVLVGSIKVLFTLYKAFFGILLDVITAPIQIMIGAFPGQGVAVGNWFKSLVRNVLTFPMVFAIVNLPNYIDSQAGITLTLPTQLTNDTNASMNVGVNQGFGGFLLMFALKVSVLYFAAEAPKFLEAWFPPNTSKAVAEGFGNARASLSKIPLIGSMFK